MRQLFLITLLSSLTVHGAELTPTELKEVWATVVKGKTLGEQQDNLKDRKELADLEYENCGKALICEIENTAATLEIRQGHLDLLGEFNEVYEAKLKQRSAK